LAAEIPSRRVARLLRRIAADLEGGVPLAVALESQGSRFPSHLRGLILAGVQTGRLAETFEEFVAIQRSRIELRHRLWTMLIYPMILLAMVLGLYVFASVFLVQGMVKVFRDFGTELPALTQLMIRLTSPAAVLFVLSLVVWLIAGTMLVAALRPRFAWPQRLCYAVPVLGPLWRWSRLAEFSRLMSLLLDQQVPLPKSLRLAADGLGDAWLAAGCRELARMVENGRDLSGSLVRVRQFPASLRPLVRWGQETPNLAQAFRSAAEMFAGRVHVQSTFLDAILLPSFLVIVFASVGLFIVSFMIPLIALIQKLS
jgi:type II secretory pathway component PulF